MVQRWGKNKKISSFYTFWNHVVFFCDGPHNLGLGYVFEASKRKDFMSNSLSNDEDYFLFSYTVFEFHIDNIEFLWKRSALWTICTKNAYSFAWMPWSWRLPNQFICFQFPPTFLFCFGEWDVKKLQTHKNWFL